MAWPWNKPAPQGETEEQKKAREQGEQDAFISKLNENFQQLVKPINDKVDAMQARWTKLETDASNEAADEHRRAEEASLTDEQKAALRQQIERRQDRNLAISSRAMVIEDQIAREFETKFPKFVPKFRELCAATNMEVKAREDYAALCRNAMKTIIGDAAINGGLSLDGDRFYLEDATSRTTGETHEFLGADMTWKDPISGKVLTGRDQLAKLGINADEFAKSVKAGTV
jgi:hypothetical protein